MLKLDAPAISLNKRPSCSHCLRPQRTCICQWITPTTSAIELLLLQHPLEANNAKGSARLLHMSLPNSRLIVAEQFAEATLQALLYEPFEDTEHAQKICPILLYPQHDLKNTVTNEATPAATVDLTDQQHANRIYRLIVLDGTWRKSRKMLALNPMLKQLSRLSLDHPPTSHYTIRKAHRPDQLSTFEASCLALIQMEKNTEKYQPLLNAFDGFVAQQQSYLRNTAAKITQ